MLEMYEKMKLRGFKLPVSFGNVILYRMCRERPKHVHLDTIASKVWLIGRSYAAAIERGAGKKIKKGEDFYMKQVAPAIKRAEIDHWIGRVLHIKRLTVENIGESLRCHKLVMDLFGKIAGGRTKRALASKYLHFHAPYAFFIYDSRATSRVRQELRKRRGRIVLPKLRCDEKYKKFCLQCLLYREILEKEMKMQITPRDLDSKLLDFHY